MQKSKISTDAARQWPRHPNKLPRQRHPSNRMTSNHHHEHPTAITTSNHHHHYPYHPHHHRIHQRCPAPDRSNAKPAAAVRRRRERQRNERRRPRKRGRKAGKPGRQVTRSWREALSTENQPVGARKTGKKTSKPHPPPLFFITSSPVSVPPTSRKTSVQRAREDAAADQAGLPAKLSE
jgi:hypothetical protein